MFFLPCICIIICFIISAITYTYNKAKDRAVDKAINDDIQDDFVCLGDVYIDKYSIESIYLDDNNQKNANYSKIKIIIQKAIKKVLLHEKNITVNENER